MLFLYESKKILKNKIFLAVLIVGIILSFVVGLTEAPDIKAQNYEGAYLTQIDDIIYNAKINYFRIEDKSSEEAIYQLNIVEKYTNIRDNNVNYDVLGVQSLLSSVYPCAIALLIGVFTAVILIYTELSSSQVLVTFKKPRIKLMLMKVSVLGAIIAFVLAVFSALQLLGSFFSCGICGLTAPIQAIQEYIRCPYDLTVIEAILIKLLIMFCGIFSVSLIAMLITVITKSFLASCLCTTVYIGTSLVLGQSSVSVFKIYNIGVILSDSWMKKYSGILLGPYFSQLDALIIFSIIVILLLLPILFVLFRKISLIHNTKTKTDKEVSEQKSRTIISYEIKKLFFGKPMLTLGVMLILQLLVLNVFSGVINGDYEKIYKHYVTEMSGMSYEEQTDYVISEKINASKTIADASKAKNLYKEGKETEENLLRLQQMAGAATSNLSVLETIGEHLSSIGVIREDGIEATLVYSTGWKYLFEYGSSLILMLCISLIMIPYIAVEEDTEMLSILSPMFCNDKNVKKKFARRKQLVMLLVSFFIILIFKATDIIFCLLNYGLPDVSAYAVGAGINFYYPSMRLLGALLINAITSLLGVFLIIAWVGFLKRITKKTLHIIILFAITQIVFYIISTWLNKFVVLDISGYFGYALLNETPISPLIQCAVIGIGCAVYKTVEKLQCKTKIS